MAGRRLGGSSGVDAGVNFTICVYSNVYFDHAPHFDAPDEDSQLG